MIFNHNEERELRRIEIDLVRSDPRLSGMLVLFGRLYADEDMPAGADDDTALSAALPGSAPRHWTWPCRKRLRAAVLVLIIASGAAAMTVPQVTVTAARQSWPSTSKGTTPPTRPAATPNLRGSRAAAAISSAPAALVSWPLGWQPPPSWPAPPPGLTAPPTRSP
jgi:hypothetical protein